MNERIRAQLDDRSERMHLKIRDAQLARVPYMFVVGDKEQDSSTVAVRLRDGGDVGSESVGEATNRVAQAIAARS